MRGGKRPGAGRKPGVPNRATQARQEEIAASGLTPLEYLIGVLRDDGVPTDVRLEAAKAAAPYVHPRLASVDLHSTGRSGIVVNVQRIDAKPRD